MNIIVWLIGSPGCGKEVISKLFMAAYSHLNFVRISTSAVLKGGRPDGLNVDDNEYVHSETVKYLNEVGYYDFEKSSSYIFDGAGRNDEQVVLMMDDLKECGRLSRNTHVLKLNVNSKDALHRMMERWRQNSLTGNLRKEEIGLSENEVRQVFIRRIRIWCTDRKRVFSALESYHSRYDFNLIDINAGQSVAEVVLDAVDEIGLPRDPMIDTLRDHKFISPEEYGLIRVIRDPLALADTRAIVSQ